MSKDDNLGTLVHYYDKQVNALIKKTKNIYMNVLVVLFLNVFMFVFLLVMMAAHSDQDAEDRNSLIGLAFLSLVIPAIGTYIYFSARSELKETIENTIEACTPLERNEYGDLYGICDDILEDMNMTGTPYQVLYLGSNQYFPGILEHEETSYLIVTRNFLTLVYKKPDMAKALIFHEFGHIRQEDTNNFLFNTILTKKAMILGVVMLITIFIGLAMGKFGVSLVSIVGILSFFALKGLRLESEVLADLNAVIHNKGNDLIAALQQYAVQDPAERATHLPPNDRINKLKDFMVKYNLNEPVPQVANKE